MLILIYCSLKEFLEKTTGKNYKEKLRQFWTKLKDHNIFHVRPKESIQRDFDGNPSRNHGEKETLLVETVYFKANIT